MTETLEAPVEEQQDEQLGSDLARKYRPRLFKEVIGQTAVHGLAARIASQGQLSVSSAYIFTGIRGSGKTSTARIFARAVNCLDLQPGGEPCNKCDNCGFMLDNAWGDGLIEVDAASNNGVDSIRNLTERMSMSTRAKRRVIVLDEVHSLSKSAEDALLKSLEEPSENAIWVLCTTDIEKVRLTIRSRCIELKMKSLSEPQLIGVLDNICDKEGIDVDREIIERAAYRGRGSARDAISSLQGIMLDTADDSVSQYRLLDDAIATKNPSNFLTTLEDVYAESVDFSPAHYVDHLIETLRSAMLLKIKESLVDDRNEYFEQIEGMASAFKTPRIIRALQHISNQIPNITTSGRNTRVGLEAAILTFLVPNAGTNVESVLDSLDDLHDEINDRFKALEEKIEGMAISGSFVVPNDISDLDNEVEEKPVKKERQPVEDEDDDVQPELDDDEDEPVAEKAQEPEPEADDEDEPEVEGSDLSDKDLLDIYYDTALELPGLSTRSSKVANVDEKNIEIVRVGKIATKIIVKIDTVLLATPSKIIKGFFDKNHDIEIEFIQE